MGLSNILLIPGVTDPVSELRSLLFSQGQPGGGWIPSFSQAMIAANTFGSGVTDVLDLSGNNNPFSQATPSSRAAWFREPKTGRRNLFEQTENFVNAYWTKTRVTASGQIITETADTGTHEIVRSLQSAGTIGVRYTMSCIISLTERTTVRMFFTGSAFGAQRGADFNLTTNEVTLFGVAGNLEANMAALADGKHFIRVSVDTGSTNTGVNPTIQFTDGVGVTSFAGSLTSSALIEKYQLELGSTPTPYQRVTTAFDVTEAGQRDCYGLRTDGTDDFYTTGNIDFSGTNKVTVFAAVRKRSDAALATLLQFPDTGLNAYQIEAPSSALNNYQAYHAGNSAQRSVVITQTAPDVSILVMESDLAAPSISLSRNGAAAVTSTLSTGGGNFKNAVFRLGSNAGTSRFINGDFFAIIKVAGLFPTSTINRVSQILSRITPTVNL